MLNLNALLNSPPPDMQYTSSTDIYMPSLIHTVTVNSIEDVPSPPSEPPTETTL